MSSIYLNSYDNKEKLKLVGIQEIEINILLHAGDWRRACFRIASSICSFLFSSTVFPYNGMKNSTSESGQAAELWHVKREGCVNVSCNVIPRHASQH